MKMNNSPLSKVIFALLFIALFLVPILFPKTKSSLFKGYSNPSVLMFFADGKGTKETILFLQLMISVLLSAKK